MVAQVDVPGTPLPAAPRPPRRRSGRARFAGVPPRIGPAVASLPAAPLWLALLFAIASGFVSDAGFPDRGLWIATLAGVGMFLFALLGRSSGGAFAVGLAGGLSFYLVHTEWLTVYLGPEPWLALSSLESLFWAVFAIPMAFVLREGPRVWPSRRGRVVLVPLALGALWALREAITSTWPYGGFSWGRVAYAMSESPVAPLVGWVGVSGLSFLLVTVVSLCVQLARETSGPVTSRPGASWPGAVFPEYGRRVVAVGVFTLLLVVPAWPAPTAGSTTIAAVQGNTDSGLFAEYEPGENLQRHVENTRPLYDGADVDMVVWPENGSDLDPQRDAVAERVVDGVSRAMDAPVVLGTVTFRNEQSYNTSLLWEAGVGVTDWYDKKHPVPFAEYVPDRGFWRPLAPELIDMVPRGYSFGTRDTVLDVNGVIAGISICFDITDDGLVAEMVDDGAEIILAQTNNADFGRTDENVQQLAIARLRAIETGRTVVNISTVGTSAMIAPDGSTIAALTPYEPGSMVETVPLSDTRTPASVVGAPLSLLIYGFGIAAFATVAVFRRRNNAPPSLRRQGR
jgi:apolipoprotein N-acyltransferase